MPKNFSNKKVMSPFQKIEDYYFNLGYRGEKLRIALQKDTQYQNLVLKRKRLLSNEIGVSMEDKKKYPLLTEVDFEILGKCKKLEKMSLSKNDKEIVVLIKSQLLDDWRSPLLKQLKKILKNY